MDTMLECVLNEDNECYMSDASDDEQQFIAIPPSPENVQRLLRSTNSNTSLHEFSAETINAQDQVVTEWLNEIENCSTSSKFQCIYCDRSYDTETEKNYHVKSEHIDKSSSQGKILLISKIIMIC